ncbi:MAG: hypothetical protein FGM14_08255 [Flavobacteriales bacterium]|nr:hypothetical protein [Flavobacteriales bacterium]
MYFLCCKPSCLPECNEWIMFGLGVIASIIWALYVYSFRPKLKIGIPELSIIDNKSIIIPITNNHKKRKATRLKVEVAIIENSITYHLLNDSDDFAFLPVNQTRKFKAYKLGDYLTEMLNLKFDETLNFLDKPNAKLRVRVHATDSFSGLGETFEECFVAKKSDWKRNGFI